MEGRKEGCCSQTPDSLSLGLEPDTLKSAAIAGPVMDCHAQHWLSLKLLPPEGCRRESGKRERERLKTERSRDKHRAPYRQRVHTAQR